MEVRQTRHFSGWFKGLRDTRAKARIAVRIDRLTLGNPGDVKPVGSGVSELRIPYGPGYRLYYVQKGDTLVILLCGGHKGSQRRDIIIAKTLAVEILKIRLIIGIPSIHERRPNYPGFARAVQSTAFLPLHTRIPF